MNKVIIESKNPNKGNIVMSEREDYAELRNHKNHSHKQAIGEITRSLTVSGAIGGSKHLW